MSIIIKPYITEKAAAFIQQDKYLFIVHKKANKVEIKKEIEKQYNVTVLAVNTARYEGKKVTRYTRKHVNKGKKSLYKKATIQLKKGEKLDLQRNTIQ